MYDKLENALQMCGYINLKLKILRERKHQGSTISQYETERWGPKGITLQRPRDRRAGGEGAAAPSSLERG